MSVRRARRKAAATVRIEDIASHAAFRRLDTVVGVQVDLRYAGSRNFEGRALYDGIDCGWLRGEAAAGLEAAVAWLMREHPALHLVVLDALRPQRVQEAIWRDVAGTPAALYFANPDKGSIHSFGMAVDVTLGDAEGFELDMGSDFDDMVLASHPGLEARTSRGRCHHARACGRARDPARRHGRGRLPRHSHRVVALRPRRSRCRAAQLSQGDLA